MDPGEVVPTPGLSDCRTESLKHRKLILSTCVLGQIPQRAGAVKHPIRDHRKCKKFTCQLIQRIVLDIHTLGPLKDHVFPSPPSSRQSPECGIKHIWPIIDDCIRVSEEKHPDIVILELQTNC